MRLNVWQQLLVLGAISAISLGIFALSRSADAVFNTPDPIPGQVRVLTIDTNITGNTFTHVDSPDGVLYVSPGQTFAVDVAVDEIDPSDGVAGFEANLTYGTGSFSVLDIDPGSMVFAQPPSQPIFFHDPLPDTDGSFQFGISDNGPNVESGEGVLARITLRCDGADTTTLDMHDALAGNSSPSIFTPMFNTLPIQFQQTAQVLCGSTPTPSPICSPSPNDPDCDQIYDPFDNCPNVHNPGQEDGDGDGRGDVCDNCPSWANAAQSLPSWTVPTGDSDCDGFPGAVAAAGRASESFIGTDVARHCAANPGVNNEPLPDAWPMDFNDDQMVGLADVSIYSSHFGSIGPNPPYAVRFDLNGDNRITLPDVSMFSQFFGQRCAP